MPYSACQIRTKCPILHAREVNPYPIARGNMLREQLQGRTIPLRMACRNKASKSAYAQEPLCGRQTDTSSTGRHPLCR
jgi:hypothetical protein